MMKARQEGLLKMLDLTTTIGTTNMHLFVKKGLIKKYVTPEEIVEDFFGLRLEYYEKRKGLRHSRKKGKHVQAAVVGATDDAAEESEESDVATETNFVLGSDYGYLLSLDISSLTLEKVLELMAERYKMKEEVEELKKATPRALLLRDLRRYIFVRAYDSSKGESQGLRRKPAKGQKQVRKKQATKKTTKKATTTDGPARSSRRRQWQQQSWFH
ncbi:unnamed protein product [Cochlearia groenlandica]